MQTVPPGNARSAHTRLPPGSHSCPPPLDTTTTESSGALKLGGAIVSPRASDRECFAWDLKLSRYDIALLATANYHGREDGVQMLTEQHIHDCGYSSILPKSPKDVLICYRDLIMLHRKVVNGWIIFCTGRSGPSVEYKVFLRKLLCIFQRLRLLRCALWLNSMTSSRGCQTSSCLCPLIQSNSCSTSRASVRWVLALCATQRSRWP